MLYKYILYFILYSINNISLSLSKMNKLDNKAAQVHSLT